MLVALEEAMSDLGVSCPLTPPSAYWMAFLSFCAYCTIVKINDTVFSSSLGLRRKTWLI